MVFGEYFRNLRRNHNFTQKQIAEVIGKSSMYVSGVETGKNGPFADKDLAEIANSLCLSDIDKRELMKKAAFERGNIPTDVFEYLAHNENAYEIVEILAEKNIKDDSLKRIKKYVEGLNFV